MILGVTVAFREVYHIMEQLPKTSPQIKDILSSIAETSYDKTITLSYGIFVFYEIAIYAANILVGE